MPLRITGGRLKGRRLAPLKGMSIRPTSDRVREAVFDIIGQELSGMRVLDLFAGTGSLGIESFSRGASEVIFVDNSTQALGIIKKNLRLFGLEMHAVVLKRDLRRGLPAGVPLLGKNFDLVFLDPPYGRGLIPPVLSGLSVGDYLADGSMVVAEASKGEELPASFGTLRMVNHRMYGDTTIFLYVCEFKNESENRHISRDV